MTEPLIPVEPDFRHSFDLLVGSIGDYELHATCEFLSEDRDYFVFPAALGHHHAYKSGLIQHTLEMTRIALQIAETVPGVNHDVLVTAALWHDWGKVIEYKEMPEAPGQYYRFTEANKHIAISAEQFKKVYTGTDPDPVVHCILAHHGRKDWGSPEEPDSVEALILHQADMLSAHYGESRDKPTE